jgi:hypothetical protein
MVLFQSSAKSFLEEIYVFLNMSIHIDHMGRYMYPSFSLFWFGIFVWLFLSLTTMKHRCITLLL